MQTFQNGLLHVITACDVSYGIFSSDPFWIEGMGDTGNEQCFDCVCIDKKHENISFIRVGVGGNRFFHLQPIKLKVGEERIINISQKGEEYTWHSYNSSGNKFDDNLRFWTLHNTIVSIDNQGVVKGIAPGEAVVLNMNEKGDKEFFNIIVEE